jgi:hypothetical protein
MSVSMRSKRIYSSACSLASYAGKTQAPCSIDLAKMTSE